MTGCYVNVHRLANKYYKALKKLDNRWNKFGTKSRENLHLTLEKPLYTMMQSGWPVLNKDVLRSTSKIPQS